MSLINQMLKDLEQNKRQADQRSSLLGKLRSVSEPSSSMFRHPAWLLVFAILVVIAIFMFIPRPQHRDDKAVQTHAEKLTKAINSVSSTLPTPPTATSTPAATTVTASVPTPAPAATATVPVTTALAAQQEPKPKPLLVEQQKVLHVSSQSSDMANQPVKQSVPLNTEQQVEQLYQQAQDALDLSDDDKATASLEQLLRIKPEHVQARELLASVLLTDNQLDKAEKVVNVGLHRLPHYAPYANLKARIFMNRGKIAQAIHELSQAQPELDQSPDYYALLAALYQQSGKYLLAAQLYHQLVQFDPANAVWWMGLGVALESAEKNNAAVEAYQHALKAVGLSAPAKAYVEQQIAKLS